MDFVRTIHMGMSAHPGNLPLTRGGHSIGSWDGDTLVVDTVDAEARTLTREYRVEDPLYLKQPYTGRDVMAESQEPYTPYECVELSGDNNKRLVR